MIWLPAGGAKSPPSAETIARGEHYIRMEGKETYRFATQTLASTALDAVRQVRPRSPPTSTCSSRTRPTSGSSRRSRRASTCRWTGCSSNLDKYGNTSAASVPIALAEAVNEGRVKVGDKIVIVAFGAGFTSRRGRRSSGPPTRRAASRATRRSTRRRRRPAAGRLGLGRPDPAMRSPRIMARPGHGGRPARRRRARRAEPPQPAR